VRSRELIIAGVSTETPRACAQPDFVGPMPCGRLSALVRLSEWLIRD